MKVFPGSSLLQITQGVASSGRKNSAADPAQFKAALQAAGPQAPPLQQTRPPQTAAAVHAGPPDGDMPPRNLPRGSILDIKI